MIEYRKLQIEQRAAGSRTVEGYAAVFNRESRDIGFIETIAPGAIDDALLAMSDVYALLNHDPDKIFARSNSGNGSLQLYVDDIGLHYRFEAPNNDLGNTLLEFIDRGDISEASFAFHVAEDLWERRADGNVHRTVLKIDGLYDISAVWTAAYPDASVQHRNIPSDYEEQINCIDENMTKELEERLAKLEAENVELRSMIEKRAEEPQEDPEEKKPEEEEPRECDHQKDEDEQRETEEQKEEPKEEQKEQKENSEDDSEDEERKLNDKNIFIKQKMEKRFSLVEEIRKQLNSSNPQSISLIHTENRAYSVTDEGDDVVVTDVYNVLPALRAKNVLVNAGARFITGLDKEVQIPVMTGGQVAWKGELAAADDGSGSFDHVTLTPHRLTGKFPISLELLAMDSTNVEDIIREDIAKAVSDKLEATILSADAATADKPAGIGYVLTPIEISDFGDIAYMESEVEDANISGNMKYVASPKYKATLRSTIKGTNATGMIFENGEIDGTPVEVTTHVPSKNAFYGDFSQLYIAQFGDMSIDVVRDSYTLANGQAMIIVNGFFDGKAVRPEAFAMSYVA